MTEEYQSHHIKMKKKVLMRKYLQFRIIVFFSIMLSFLDNLDIYNIYIIPSKASGLTTCVAIGVGSTIPSPVRNPGTAKPEYLESH